MGAVDIKPLMEAIAQDNPCGVDLRNDPKTFQLQNAARGKPGRLEGGKEVPAEEPDWSNVRELAENILKESKDLRVAMHLTRSLVRTEGYPGLAAGLALLRNLIVEQWAFVHPRLDPEDKSDPTERLNILQELSDPERLLFYVRAAPLVASREFGRFSLRDYEIASGRQPLPTGTVAATITTIEACFRAADLETIQSTGASIQQCIEDLNAIEAVLPEKLAPESPPSFSPLLQTLKAACKLIDARVGQRSETDVGIPAPAAPGQSVAISTPVANSGPGSIRNREDCIKALDMVADYFRKQERSSPVPLLLERAKRLMSKDFLEIMQDLAPDGVSQATKVFGTEPKKT